ncbi:MAG: hypothetical protein GXY60_08460 [Spirochaetales bacterium]|nr:hypothetical protein [Spirochaetales bacterium]
MDIEMTIPGKKENQQLYTTKFNNLYLRERIQDGYHLESFSRIEGIDDDYLRYEIMKYHHESSLVYRLGVLIKDSIMTLCGIVLNPKTIQVLRKKEHFM